MAERDLCDASDADEDAARDRPDALAVSAGGRSPRLEVHGRRPYQARRPGCVYEDDEGDPRRITDAVRVESSAEHLVLDDIGHLVREHDVAAEAAAADSHRPLLADLCGTRVATSLT